MTDYFDPFAVDYDTTEVAEETIHEGGGAIVDKEGRYHVQITDVEYHPPEISGGSEDPDAVRKLPRVELKMSVLGGEYDSEVGKSIYHTIYLAGWKDKDGNNHRADGQIHPLAKNAFHSVLSFLHAFGAVGGEVFGKENVRITKDMLLRLEQTQAVVKLTKDKDPGVNPKTGEPYPARCRIQWNNDVWPLDHKKVADVPKDTAAMAYAGTGAVPDDDLDDI